MLHRPLFVVLAALGATTLWAAEESGTFETYPPVEPAPLAPIDWNDTTPATWAANTPPDALATYTQEAEFYRLSSPSDVPKDLVWQNGFDEPEFSSPEAKRGGTFNFWLPSFPPSLRYLGPDGNSAFRPFILDDNAVTLIKFHNNTKRWYPGLASAWAVAADGKSVYFRLNPKATYSDGVKVDADDIAFMFYFMRSPRIIDPWYNNWYRAEYTYFTKFDEHTFQVAIPNSRPDPLDRYDLKATPRHFYSTMARTATAEEEQSAMTSFFAQPYQWEMEPTTGPYMITSKDDVDETNGVIVMRRVANWWANDLKFWRFRANPDIYRFVLYRDQNVALVPFLKGDLDMMSANLPDFWYEKLNPETVEPVAKGYIQRHLMFIERPWPSWGVYLNRNQPLLSDVRVRQGINFAMNFAMVNQEFFRGDYRRLRGASDGYGAFMNPEIRARPFDPARARDLFMQAGFTESGPDGVLRKADGTQLAFVLIYNSPNIEGAMNILKNEALKAGLLVNLQYRDSTTAFKETQNKEYEAAFTAWSRVSLVYPRYWEEWHSDNAIKPQTNNITATNIPALDEMINRYDRLGNPDEIRELAWKIQEVVHEDAAFVPGWVRPWYRLATWRWLRFPKHFNTCMSQAAEEELVHWLDPELKEETLRAMQTGATFPNEDLVYDQWDR